MAFSNISLGCLLFCVVFSRSSYSFALVNLKAIKMQISLKRKVLK